MNLNDGAVNKRIFEVGVATRALEKILEHTRFCPSAEPSELAVPIPESRWQVAPWRAGPNACSILAVVLVISACLQERFGSTGMLIAAVVTGLVDAQAAAISVATLVASGKVTPQEAVVPILAGLTSNTLSKIIMAMASGGWSFALRVVPGLILVAVAAWAGTISALLWN